ncbi:RNA polymerase sigma-70 factor [Aliifodinibius salicampi]|uniref:RNA polymerase sigma-70 factor n=1 Tax=Fodinibius salicampi TaxID=1920655 RepID=A0ABT3Q145_9BACT|nr:RNA polymerase sigma-70 factor [Fodinibius salicampi]MCW9713776.1 RNA polymerase sigma-70 factor [Fodinibius salicampi]
MVDPVALQFVLIALATSSEEEMDSKVLAQKIKAGNHKAFETFFDTHYDSLLRFLISKNTSREAAKDLIQKAFIYIWEHRHRINPEKSLRAYIFQIAYTRMLNHHRDHKKFNTDESVPNRQTNHTPEDTARAKDLEQAIERAIEQMPEKRGTVFQLCFMEDFTYREAAETLEVTKKTIENHMGLALKDMRKALKQFQ